MKDLNLFTLEPDFVPIDKENKFYDITDEMFQGKINSEVVIAKLTRKVLKVMECKKSWIDKYYEEPLKEYENSPKECVCCGGPCGDCCCNYDCDGPCERCCCCCGIKCPLFEICGNNICPNEIFCLCFGNATAETFWILFYGSYCFCFMFAIIWPLSS